MYASSAKITASTAMMPMSRSQFADVCFHSGSKGGAWLMLLRSTVLAAAARPQRDGDITASCLSPTLSASGTT